MAKKPLNRSYFRYIFGAIIIGIIAAFIIYRLLLPSPIIKSISYFDNQVKTNAASTIDELFFLIS